MKKKLKKIDIRPGFPPENMLMATLYAYGQYNVYTVHDTRTYIIVYTIVVRYKSAWTSGHYLRYICSRVIKQKR